MIFKDEHTPSIVPKSFFMLSIISGISVAAYLMFTNVNDIPLFLKPYAVNGNFTRQLILISCLSLYIIRLLLTTFVFLKRKMSWTETIIISVLMSIALFTFAHVGGRSTSAINTYDYLGIVLYVFGSWINTQSEYTRYYWKQNEKNKGKLYTGGLFKFSMHINYFGDLLLFCGLVLITQSISLIIIPLAMGLNFAFHIIPSLDKYLEKKYGNDFINYSLKTKKLIPGFTELDNKYGKLKLTREFKMFKELKDINTRPKPYEFYTAEELWTDEHTSKQMLKYHLDGSIDLSSRNIKFIEKSVYWIVKHFGINENPMIADFGCGPGLYTTCLAERGAKVTGIDFSKSSIDYALKIAEEKSLKIKYEVKNYLEFKTTDRYDLIIMIMCDFSVLSPEQRKVILTKFHNLLSKDGSVLLDVYSLSKFKKKKETATYKLNQLNGFWSSNEYYAFVNSFKYEKEKVSLDKYTIIEEIQKRVVYNWLQYYSKETLIKQFEENGFTIHEFYSDVAGKPFDPESNEMAVVAKKTNLIS